MNAVKDELLGRLAVEKGWITPEQLKECVREQQRISNDPNATVGRKGSTRPLGVILVTRGYLSEKQLTDLLDEQSRHAAAVEQFQKEKKVDLMFGQLLVKYNKATQNQINKCLEIQQERIRRGVQPIPRLGELLVEHGFVDAVTIQDILKMQNKEILYCIKCSKQYNVVGVEKGKGYVCKHCGGTMLSKTLLESLKVDETQYGLEADQP